VEVVKEEEVEVGLALFTTLFILQSKHRLMTVHVTNLTPGSANPRRRRGRRRRWGAPGWARVPGA
jgi:hypothetical protein